MAGNPFNNVNFMPFPNGMPQPLQSTPYPTTGAQVPGQTSPNPSNQPFDLKSIMDFLGTPGGAAATNFAGAGLSAYGAAQTAAANRQQAGATSAAQLLQQQHQNDQSNQITRSSGVLNADPLGADQQFAQKNALLYAMLPNLKNFKSQPGDSAVAGAMGGSRGGFMDAIPQGGFGPDVTQTYSPAATMQSIVQRHQELNNLDPNAPTPDMTKSFGAQGAGPSQQLQQYAQQLQQKTAGDKQAYDTQLQKYIDQMTQQESDTGGFWHKLAKVAGIVGAGVATAMTGGAASPLLIAAIGAGAGAASSWGSGGNPLVGAIMGGVTPGLSQKLGGAITNMVHP